MISYILAVIALIICTAGVYIDYRSSMDMPMFGGKEQNSLFRGKFGFLNATKFLIFWAIFIGIGIVAAFLLSPWFSVIWLGLPGIAEIARGLSNNQKHKKNRDNVQIPILREFRRSGGSRLTDLSQYTYDGVKTSFYRQFGFIRSTLPDSREAQREVDGKLHALSLQPESTWFEVKK